MPASFDEIMNGFVFADFDGGMGPFQAFVCRQSGKVYFYSESPDHELDERPDDIDDDEKYVQIPSRKELGLGKPLVLAFVDRFLPDDSDEIRRIFSRKGAYARFKDLLHHRGAIEQWHDFEAKATQDALRKWCEAESIELSD